MPNQFRQDLVSGDWVLICPERAKKPENRERIDFTPHACPFDDPQASGQETPIAIYYQGHKVESAPDASVGVNWTIQVLPNKFPAVTPGQCGPVMEQDHFSVAAGVGSHELVITHDHDRHFANFTGQEMLEVINVYLDRYRELAKDECNKYIMIFHNHGVLAGASIKHNHSQIISMPILSPQIEQMLERSQQHFQKTGHRLTAELVALEKDRVVCENDSFVAFCPFASRSPYEINIFPKKPQSDFGAISNTEAAALSSIVREVFIRLDKAVADPDYTFFIHTAPPHQANIPFDWHIEIMPRFSPAAGIEFGAGLFVNTMDPDKAAQELRQASI